MFRGGLRALIQEQPGWQITAEVKDGRDAVAKAEQFKPDVAILDIMMPSLNGLDATKQIVKVSPHTRVLSLTIYESDQLIHKILDAGARGYVLKTDAGRDLITVVKALLSNKTLLYAKSGADGDERIFRKMDKRSEGKSSQLTAREREIVQLLAQGKGSKEVATALDLSVKTVETHRTNTLRKLHCHSVADLVRYAIRNN
jgi:DNA-binding NarL/FixJ family response regulator